ncbi:MAG: T9SS type A sorting domain-containing protein [Ignavibacteriales bacterium]|nr:T9SS type A sorting domain-containing protein [Ignavibacteriales bacterium]
MDGSGNFVIAWEDLRYGINNQDIIGQRYYANGTPNGSNYRIVADGPNYGETSPVAAANNNQIVFSWMDNRRSKGWNIYGKVVGWDWNGVTSVSDQGNNLPKEYVLEQNYPNPFNPGTKIKFSIPNVGTGLAMSVLKVYDVLGREVATLVNEEKPAGSYEVEFDASKLSSGVYYYKLSAGSFVETRKMILMK